MKTLLVIATLTITAYAQQQPAAKPADLTDAEKLAVYESVSKLRGFEITKRELTEKAEKAIRDYRDSVVKQLNEALEKLAADAKTEGEALDKKLSAKKADGWRLNPDKGLAWEKVDPPPAESNPGR